MSRLLCTLLLVGALGEGNLRESPAQGKAHTKAPRKIGEMNLHDEMRRLMQDDEDQDDLTMAPSSDSYYQDSADSLSAALGPRWNAKKLEADANKKTSALLKGISGSGKSMRRLSDMLGGLR
eukprot:TRINITY_DN51785_c0_g1_i1.p1 TRINITY_DN51785_c0_g1~~TRINITY_DN51785_c0_g1_i1.p1  ORF type:complete len:122 (+),score=32.94 TRINITY_DN51785_c0_g1_i1:67-432(+)